MGRKGFIGNYPGKYMVKRLAGILVLLILVGTLVNPFVSAQISPEARESSRLAQGLVSSKPITPVTSKNPLDSFTEAPKILGIELPLFFEVRSLITSIIDFNRPVVLGSHTYKNNDTLAVFFNPNPDLRKLTVSPSVEIRFSELRSNIQFSTKFFSMDVPGLGFSTNVNFGFG